MTEGGGVRHVPVLVREVVGLLEPERGGLFFDGTVGDGGHAEALLAAGTAAGAEIRLVGSDRDPAALDVAWRRLSRFGDRVRLETGNFADVSGWLDEPLAGALLDLGLSSRQLDEPERGFSFRAGTPLDMRMGRGAESVSGAPDLLNELSESELAMVFRRYGEEPRSRRMAAAVVSRRGAGSFRVADDLVAVIDGVYGGRAGVKDYARIFQALRIAVNEELEALDRVLPVLRELLEPGGVMVVLSYHSLEDRRVKRAFRDWSRGCVCPPELPVCVCRGRPLGETLTRRPIAADAMEVAANPRARSVRLRAWRKTGGRA